MAARRLTAVALPVLLQAAACSGPEPVRGYRPGQEPQATQLHLHASMSESSGSFAGHALQARRLGTVDVLWFTDHDWRMAQYTYPGQFTFDSGLGPEVEPRPLRRRDGSQAVGRTRMRWREFDDPGRRETSRKRSGIRARREGTWLSKSAEAVGAPAREGSGALRLRATASSDSEDFARYELRFQAEGHRGIRPLAAGIRVRLAVRPESRLGPDARIFIQALLSEQPPDLHRAELDYWLAEELPEDVESRRARLVSDHLLDYQPGRWNEVVLDLTGDAIRDGLGGLDNAMSSLLIGVEARRGASVDVLFDDLRIEHDLDGSEVLTRAREIVAPLAGEDLAIHIGQEISYGVHVTALGSGVPILDHRQHPGGLTGPEAVEFIHRHGGLAILDHPFGIFREVEGLTGDEEATRLQVDRIVEELGALDAFRADAMEVGYPLRGGMPLQAHLAAWDRLGLAGLVVTGVGSSDSHANRRGWRGKNNWVTWIWSASRGEEDLLAGLRAGACFFGDPARWDGRMDLATAGDVRMGDVVVAGPAHQSVTYMADNLRPGWAAEIIRNGQVLERVPVTEPRLEVVRSLDTGETCITRFCLADEKGETLVCSNPIYFYREAPRLLPAARIR